MPATITTQDILDARKDMLAAEREWELCLIECFGESAAADMRYRDEGKGGHGSALNNCYMDYMATRHHFLKLTEATATLRASADRIIQSMFDGEYTAGNVTLIRVSYVKPEDSYDNLPKWVVRAWMQRDYMICPLKFFHKDIKIHAIQYAEQLANELGVKAEY